MSLSCTCTLHFTHLCIIALSPSSPPPLPQHSSVMVAVKPWKIRWAKKVRFCVIYVLILLLFLCVCRWLMSFWVRVFPIVSQLSLRHSTWPPCWTRSRKYPTITTSLHLEHCSNTGSINNMMVRFFSQRKAILIFFVWYQHWYHTKILEFKDLGITYRVNWNHVGYAWYGVELCYGLHC